MNAPSNAAVPCRAPGPGLWERDAAHQERPFSTLWMEVMPFGFHQGFSEAFERFGLPFQSFDLADVDGWFFGTFTPVAEAEFAARAATAEHAIDARPWRAIAEEWTSSVRGQLLERNRGLQAVEPRALDDGSLAQHLAATLELLCDGGRGTSCKPAPTGWALACSRTRSPPSAGRPTA